MTLDALALGALILAAIPAALFAVNLLVYRRLPTLDRTRGLTSSNNLSVSVLIPARNEETNIGATLEAVLANEGCEFEVVVLDDHSTDRTAEIVGRFRDRDGRVRLETAPPLPRGWCGKQHACQVLAKEARYPLLVFIDADVRLSPDALARIAERMRRDVAALSSGVPRQILGTFSERLLLPLIHFILLGFLPMHIMRRTRWTAMSAGCGQLFAAKRDAYNRAGGHAMLRASLHDGIKLPRAFRRAGFHTALFDATDIATCRMYHSNADTWQGLEKNATEGLAAPGTIGPMSALLFGGHVLPFLLLGFASYLSATGLFCAALGTGLALIPRLVAVFCFRQPFGSALLHPVGILLLLFIQWKALIRQCLGRPAQWKGRSYATGVGRGLGREHQPSEVV